MRARPAHHDHTAQQGCTSSWRYAENGFTLVELMVVMVIVALAATAVVLAIPDARGGVTAEAERFAARAKAARDSAIVEARPALLSVDAAGYGVARRRRGEWRPQARYEWEAGTQASGGGARFDTTGLADPALVTLRRGGRQAMVEIRGDGTIHVRR